MKQIIGLTILLSCIGSPTWAATAPTSLGCEARPNPLSVDVPRPRLSWKITGGVSERGLRQSSYQVLVASTAEILAKDRGDLWDSRRVKSRQNLGVPYTGKTLISAQRVFWKVRFWDGKGDLSPWSHNATWTMGLLRPVDWMAKWIAAPDAAETVAQRLSLGYHAGETSQLEETKWIQVDLGKAVGIDQVRLQPMLHAGIAGFGFPMRFKIEASEDADFRNSFEIANHTGADFTNPGVKPVDFRVEGRVARYVRVTAVKLGPHPDSNKHAFALRQLQVFAGGRTLALHAPVSAKDSVELYGWGKAGLTDGVLTPDGEASHSEKYPTLLLRKEFVVKPGLKRAMAFVTGLGEYEMSLNGRKVGNDLLGPGWTEYRKTVLYNSRDITSSLKPGVNAVGLLLGNGMYNVLGGRYTKFTGSYGPQKAIAQIRLEYADGAIQTIGTDGSWRAAAGPITFSNMYGGEDFDARLVQRGWNEPRFNATGWEAAKVVDGPGGALKGLSVSSPPIQMFETFIPLSSRVLRPGVTVYDMGQNAAVMPRITVSGPAGSKVRIVPGELLNSDGSVNQGSAGGGPSYWQYTLGSAGRETYSPRFFYFGSRYQQVEVMPAAPGGPLPQVEALTTTVVHAASPVIGQFSSSNELFNRTWQLVRTAQRSNMMSVMTDCPHREKLGWLEEDYLNGPALRYNFDMGPLFAKVMNDMADAQLADGMVPSVAPEYVKFGEADGNPFRNSPEWGSAFIQVAWQQFRFNGDLELLRRHYEGVKRYVAYLSKKSSGHIVDFGLGDWFDIGPGEPGFGKLTPRALTSTATYFSDAEILMKTAGLLGNKADAEKYRKLAEDIRVAFNTRFFNEEAKTYATNSQTSNAMPLALGLVAPQHKAAVLEAIVKDVQSRGNALTSGDVGYRYLLRALAEGGRSDVIYAMNNQSEKPGYGFQLKRGATSLTEAWDANPGPSQNHFMLGQINEWFYHDLAGIQAAGPGFSEIDIRPAFLPGLNRVSARFESPYGKIGSEWVRKAGHLTLAVAVPGNTSATVYLPTKSVGSVTESGKLLKDARGVQILGVKDGVAALKVGSGRYVFDVLNSPGLNVAAQTP